MLHRKSLEKSVFYDEVLKSFFDFSKLDLETMLMNKDKRFSETKAKEFIHEFKSNLDVSVEVFRGMLCMYLDLETSFQYSYYRVLSSLGAMYLVEVFGFNNDTLPKRQAMLEYCMQAILITKKRVLMEVNNGHPKNS